MASIVRGILSEDDPQLLESLHRFQKQLTLLSFMAMVKLAFVLAFMRTWRQPTADPVTSVSARSAGGAIVGDSE